MSADRGGPGPADRAEASDISNRCWHAASSAVKQLPPSRPADATVLAASVLRQSLIPMAAFYLILMTALGVGLRSLYRRGAGQTSGPQYGPAPVRGSSRGWGALTRHVAGTVVGGYLLLLAVVTAYYYGIARVGGAFLYSAVTGAALLIGLTMPVFATLSWISEWAHRRREELPDEAQSPPQ
jgi:Family of unknown function (DUF6256)